MLTPPSDSPIAPPLQQLLDLFASELKAVKFPDMDAGVLEAAASKVRERADAVARAEAALEAARAALGESQDALLAKGQRALAYARVFAEENPDLSSRLEALSLPRPPKARTNAPLFSEDAGAPEGPQAALG
ncbi:MAG TPA: hypothetical protein VK447_08225 [Myxococcaceae bacterium]|nr:hypothetical protein [Myxococcaceae bacterium]